VHDRPAANACALASREYVKRPMLACNEPQLLEPSRHYYWSNEHGEAEMPWVIPHGTDDDPLYHHRCDEYSQFPALNISPLDCKPRKEILDIFEGKRSLVHIATHCDLHGSDGDQFYRHLPHAGIEANPPQQ